MFLRKKHQICDEHRILQGGQFAGVGATHR